jgi:agmatine deiminase
MAVIAQGTPAEAGFAMPAEWDAHAGCLMSWPVRTELWGTRLEEAKRDYAAMARAVAGFEPLTMVCRPGSEREVRNLCGEDISTFAAPLDDSWSRDNGPIFVRDAHGRLAIVDFTFNAWGERWHPYDSDDALPERVADHFGLSVFKAPMVLEGGSFYVDGAGTLLTTEQCLLHPNRNPSMTRDDIEQTLRDYLGVSTIVWLPFGQTLDTGPEATDGHVDGIAQYVGPGRVLLEAPASVEASEHDTGAANLKVLEASTDAAGRPFEIEILDAGPGDSRAYCNFYIANGGVIVPISGHPRDDEILEQIGSLFPDRQVVGVPGEVIAFGGGGPHCITQQIPVGTPSLAG